MNNKVLKINVKIELLFLFSRHEVMGVGPNANFLFIRGDREVMFKLEQALLERVYRAYS